jgi:hypothetical protein
MQVGSFTLQLLYPRKMFHDENMVAMKKVLGSYRYLNRGRATCNERRSVSHKYRSMLFR